MSDDPKPIDLIRALGFDSLSDMAARVIGPEQVETDMTYCAEGGPVLYRGYAFSVAGGGLESDAAMGQAKPLKRIDKIAKY